MGHVRVDECAGTEHTKGQPLYNRISFVLQRLSPIREKYSILRNAMQEAQAVLSEAIERQYDEPPIEQIGSRQGGENNQSQVLTRKVLASLAVGADELPLCKDCGTRHHPKAIFTCCGRIKKLGADETPQ